MASYNPEKADIDRSQVNETTTTQNPTLASVANPFNKTSWVQEKIKKIIKRRNDGLAFNRSRDPLSSGGNFIRRGIAFGGVKRKR